MKACQGRSQRIGACGDLGYWMRSGIDPIEAVRCSRIACSPSRCTTCTSAGPQGHDVPWGTGAGKTEQFLRRAPPPGLKPTMFGLEYSYNWLESMPEIAQSIEFFNQVSLELAKRDAR